MTGKEFIQVAKQLGWQNETIQQTLGNNGLKVSLQEIKEHPPATDEEMLSLYIIDEGKDFSLWLQ